MSHERMIQLEGRQVGVAVADGSRIDDCQLGLPTRRAHPMDVHNGLDAFVPLSAVRDVWEIVPRGQVV
jgi:hypothetical protein